MKALVDSGCTNCLMDLEWARRAGLEPSPLQNLITMFNVDGSQSRAGKILYGIDLLVRVGDALVLDESSLAEVWREWAVSQAQ